MHVTRRTSKLAGIICEGDLFGPVEPASRFHGNTFMLVIAVITKKSPAYLYVYGLRSKRDVHHGLRQFFIDMLSHGVEISAMITDSGSEFRGPEAREVFARQGVYHEQRAPNRHALRAEGAIRRIYLAVRASLLDAGAPPDVWDRAVATAVDAINCRINPMYTMSAHEALFGYKPDLVPLLPFLCWVSIKESRDRPRFSPDTRPFRYFGPARSHGAHSIFAGATADAISSVFTASSIWPRRRLASIQILLDHTPIQPSLLLHRLLVDLLRTLLLLLNPTATTTISRSSEVR